MLALLIFIPRLLNLDVFLTPDEPLVLKHAREFSLGVTSGNFTQTLGIGWPGVTVAGWSSAVIGLASTELGAYVAGRIATAIVTGLLLLLVYVLARSLLGHWPAFIGISLLALDPYILAYSRLLHIDASLALFMTLAGLAYLLWLRDVRRCWLLLTGLFTGLALLTKSTALLLGPMLGVVLVSWSIGTRQWDSWKWWRPKLGGLAAVAFCAGVTFFVLWPAMWVDPAQALTLTFSRLFTDQEAGAGNLGLFWLGRFVEDPGPMFYPVAFLLKSTPWLLVGLLLNLWFVLRNPQYISRHSQPATRILVITLWLFALIYLVLMTIASKKSIRYMLPAFPAFYLLAGWAFYQMGKLANQPIGGWRMKVFPFSLPLPVSYLLLFISYFLPLLFTFFYHPYYFTYYNPLVLGWRWAPQTLLVGWGEGLDEAARYLQAQPPHSVSAWYNSLFPMFYDGPVEPVVPPENLITADRMVLYINQVQRDIPNPNVIHYFRARRRPEYTVRLNGIDYAWVYSGPVVGFDRPDPMLQYPLGSEFGGEARLLGYNLGVQPRSGSPLIVTLSWRVLAPPPTERFVYLRLVDGQGRIWAQADSPPVMGLWPVDRWQSGMLLEDAQELPIPPGTPPGVYRLEVGWYDPVSGQVLPASGQPVGQGGGLLLGEIQIEWQSLPAEPDLPNQTDIRLAPNARLIGYDSLPAFAITGDVLPLRLAWREAKTLTSLWALPNDFVMFQWRPSSGSVNGQPAQQLDELPLPIAEWGRGATLLSQHQVIVPPTLDSGKYELLVTLHTSSDPAGEPFSLGWVEVLAPPHQFDLPVGVILPVGANQLAQTVDLLGYDLNLIDQLLTVNLFWQTREPLTSGYKVFVQLLSPANTLLAQSDAFPAAGQRPTTGWLPGEIITDPHALVLPADLPAGDYRLITGLYNPTTGERLPILGENGEVVADAIFVTEVTVP
ncbi:MAG: glycosyltransferase family 39 protein [Anaerolineae bacterium]|nr:glycosyltransferase family 39 protein [Anaerolineae bacterium]